MAGNPNPRARCPVCGAGQVASLLDRNDAGGKRYTLAQHAVGKAHDRGNRCAGGGSVLKRYGGRWVAIVLRDTA